MMKKTLRLASLTFLMFGCAVASEYRPALGVERGSTRNDMGYKAEKESPWDIEMWSTAFSRNANKAFLKHGAKSKPLSALLFGKDSFKVADAFTPNMTSDYTEEFNANLGATKLNPRVTYSEQGVSLGVNLGYRVNDGRGTVGLKAHVPVKTVRMERDDQAELAATGGAVEDYVIGDPFNASQLTGAVIPPALPGVLATANIPVQSNMYRVSLVQNLPMFRGGQADRFIGSTTVDVNGGNNNPVVQVGGGAAYQRQQPNNDFQDAWDHGYKVAQALPYAVAFSDSERAPILRTRAMALPNAVAGLAGQTLQFPAGQNVQGSLVDIGNKTLQGVDSTAGAAAGAAGSLPQTLTALPTAAGDLETNTMYVFTVDGAAGGANNAPAQLTRMADYRDLVKKQGDNLWLVTMHNAAGAKLDAGTDALLQDLIRRYASQTAEQWLWANRYHMQTNQRSGLGDLTITPYYDHVFSDDWSAGAYLHVSLPTGASNKTGTNPYKAILGNGNHVEVGGGAHVGWQALSWMNVRLDAMAAHALRGKEQIAAPFKGATIKGIGPVVSADVDYSFVKGSLDTTLTHPHAASLATTIGYDFVYKTKDNVSLASAKMKFKNLADDANSWFGGKWDNGAGAFQEWSPDLDPKVQSKDTERVQHVFRMESSWHATHHMSMFVGGSTVPFGQNATKMPTIYGGMNVKF